MRTTTSPAASRRPNSRSARTDNIIATSRQIIEVARETGDLFPPLKTVCGVGLFILRTTETVRGLKQDHAKLAERIAERIAAVVAESTADDAIPEDLQGHIDVLLRSLEEIKGLMDTQAKIGWFKTILRSKELTDRLRDCNAKLDDCDRIFSVCASPFLPACRVIIANAF
jgi:hypothetical protein